MIFSRFLVVIVICTAVLSIGYDWGIPSNERSSVLFSDKNEHNNMVEVLASNYRTHKDKTKNKIYIDNYSNYVKSMDYDVSIKMSLARYLMVPYAADDAFVLKAIKNLDPYKYDFDPNYYVYGGGLIYTSALMLKIADMVGYLELKPDIAFYLENPEMTGRIYKVLRLLVLFFSVIGIGIIYLYTHINHGKWVALLTTILILVNPESIASSHAIEPHMYVLPIFAISLYYAYKYHESRARSKDYILAAIFAGLSIGTQASSIYITVPILITMVIAFLNMTGAHNLKIIKDFLKYFVLVVFVVLLINPYYILNIEGLLQDLSVGTGNQMNTSGILKHYWAHYQISTFLLILFATSIPYNLIILRDRDTLFYFGIIVPAIIIYLVTGNIMQYIYPSLMVFSIISSLMLLDIYRRLPIFSKKYFVMIILALIVISPGTRSLYYLINYKHDSRIEAGKWLNSNVPVTSNIGMTFPPTNYDSIPFRFHKYNLIDVSLISSIDNTPEYIILVNRDMPINIKNQYSLIKTFAPKSVFGYRPILKGEVAAIYAKTTKIYKKTL